MKNKDLFLPLQEPTLYILLSLRGGEKHGYAVLKEVAELSSGRVKLSTGTLYGALYRLLDQGLIEQIEPEKGARGKKTYRFTAGFEPHGLRLVSSDQAALRRPSRSASQPNPSITAAITAQKITAARMLGSGDDGGRW